MPLPRQKLDAHLDDLSALVNALAAHGENPPKSVTGVPAYAAWMSLRAIGGYDCPKGSDGAWNLWMRTVAIDPAGVSDVEAVSIIKRDSEGAVTDTYRSTVTKKGLIRFAKALGKHVREPAPGIRIELVAHPDPQPPATTVDGHLPAIAPRRNLAIDVLFDHDDQAADAVLVISDSAKMVDGVEEVDIAVDSHIGCVVTGQAYASRDADLDQCRALIEDAIAGHLEGVVRSGVQVRIG